MKSLELADERALDDVNLAEAKTAIVLGTTEHGDDGWHTVAIVARLAAYLLRREAKDVHIIAEVSDPRLMEDAKRAGAREVVCTRTLGRHMLVNAAVHPGVSEFFDDLLTKEKDTNEIYMVAVPALYVSKSFNELSAAVIVERKRRSITLVGLKRNDKVVVNPSGDVVLESTDMLLVMARGADEAKVIHNIK